MRLAALAVAVVAGCYSPSFTPCAITCDEDAPSCPSGYDCVGGFCQSGNECSAGGDTNGGVGWRYRKRFTVEALGNVTDFPLLVRITDPQLMAHAQSSGLDIKFETIDGVLLPHEIEAYESGTGSLVAWVRVPALSASSTSDFFMYYGNPDARGGQATAVWDADYLGVYHFNDAPGMTVADSTAAGRNATKVSMASPMPVAGNIGGAHLFDGVNALTLGSDSAFDIPALTFEAWVRVVVPASQSEHRLFELPTTFVYHRAFGYYDVQVPTAPGAFAFVTNPPNALRHLSETGVVAIDTWKHVVVTFQPNSLFEFALDGVSRNTTNAGNATGPVIDLISLGGSVNSGIPALVGALDELRISRVARSYDYMRATWLQSLPGANVLTFMLEQEL